jgi:CheY-like chemotaxis protein
MNAAKRHYDEPSGNAKRTILVVEDVVLVRLVVAEQLRQAGFEVIEARTADEAIRLLGAPVQIDLVFSDVHLPDSSLDGFGLAQWLTDKRPEVKVLLTSGQVPSPGPNGENLLVKPYQYPALIQRLRALLSLPPHGD